MNWNRQISGILAEKTGAKTSLSHFLNNFLAQNANVSHRIKLGAKGTPET
jgi:hypothetical protein